MLEVVRSLGQECYELIAGERRLRASRMSGLARVPVVVMNINREQASEIALIENLQREDLNPVEETEAILGLISLKFDIRRDNAIAALYSLNNKVTKGSNHNVMVREDDLQKLFNSLGCGKWQSFVKNRLPFLKLPTDILEALCSGKIAYTKALVITRMKDEQGKSAFASWFNKLNPQAAVKVTTYLTRVEMGNFSQLKGIGSGVHELRIDWGPGYRVYMGRDGDTLIILLDGGTKKR
ncbi:MAG: ParB/RepB/Spo0J family partition protein [Symploca sp. SIO1C4]|uniref:ParB/RepB/Spo0J family partition protein n=1 Tax=Symploca sp. SIO1C4 TaxID=2607765 RepID=A0A6B3N4H6_9CYAN|nr:ParB/RepB/Spo0J family partition protein [Symploca sp. SIO1C4]